MESTSAWLNIVPTKGYYAARPAFGCYFDSALGGMSSMGSSRAK